MGSTLPSDACAASCCLQDVANVSCWQSFLHRRTSSKASCIFITGSLAREIHSAGEEQISPPTIGSTDLSAHSLRARTLRNKVPCSQVCVFGAGEKHSNRAISYTSTMRSSTIKVVLYAKIPSQVGSQLSSQSR